MTEEEAQSKRQRQKERRAAKREAQQREAAAAKRRRTLTSVAIVVLVVAGIGALVAGQVRGLLDRRAIVAEAEERSAAAGCTGIEEMPHLGASHFPQDATADDLAAVPPADIYDHRPTTSGPHFGQVAVTGVYDDYVDERLVVHNMEHGYVIVWWDPELSDDEVAEIREWAAEQIDGRYPKIVAAPYEGPLPDGGSVAFTSWDHRQLCDEFDPRVAEAYLIDQHDRPDVPEAGRSPHHGDLDGELDPATDAVVFSPFTDAVPGQAVDLHDDEDESAE